MVAEGDLQAATDIGQADGTTFLRGSCCLRKVVPDGCRIGTGVADSVLYQCEFIWRQSDTVILQLDDEPSILKPGFDLDDAEITSAEYVWDSAAIITLKYASSAEDSGLNVITYSPVFMPVFITIAPLR